MNEREGIGQGGATFHEPRRHLAEDPDTLTFALGTHLCFKGFLHAKKLCLGVGVELPRGSETRAVRGCGRLFL